MVDNNETKEKALTIILFWLILPFIPLFLIIHYTFLFYLLLTGYVLFFNSK